MAKEKENPADFTIVYNFFKRNLRTLIIMILLSSVFSIVFSSSWFLKPKYKSTVIVYPANTNYSLLKNLLNPTSWRDVFEFGTEIQGEQLIQFLKSDDLREKIVNKYHLYKYAGIDSTSPRAWASMRDEYEDMVRIGKTEFNSIILTVETRDAVMSSNMANDIIAYSDTLKFEVHKKMADEAMRVIEGTLLEKEKNIKAMEDSLDMLRGLGVHEYKEQIKELYRALYLPGTDKKAIQANIALLARYSEKYNHYNDIIRNYRVEYSQLLDQEDKVRAEQNNQLPGSFVISHAYPDWKKSYPVRWLIVFISLLITLAITIPALIFKEKKTGNS